MSKTVQFFPRTFFFVFICVLCTLIFAVNGLPYSSGIMGLFTITALLFWRYDRALRRLNVGPPPAVDAETLMKTAVNEALRRGEPIFASVDGKAIHVEGRSSSGRPVVHLRCKSSGAEVYTTHPEFYADDPKWERVS